jgi:hypothetical protein
MEFSFLVVVVVVVVVVLQTFCISVHPCFCNFTSCINVFSVECLHLFGRLCGLVVIVLGYRSGGAGSIPGTTRKK